VLLNQKAVELLGYKNPIDAINSKLSRGRKDTLTVVGVLADYHHQGLQKVIDPMIFLIVSELLVAFIR
jgi:putative ABC transport system permease protein